MKYKVYGTIQYNFSKVLEAESEDAAERATIAWAEDGMIDLDDPVDDAEITRVELISPP